jgi:hypothetical protein
MHQQMAEVIAEEAALLAVLDPTRACQERD